jgi:deoxycytidine triphosphate deaminase
MFLNYQEIIAKGLISFSSVSEFSNASYNLTVKEIIDMNGKKTEEDNYRLVPQGMVYVVFKEVIQMPEDIIGFAHVKTSLTKRGIMATNIGIIDPTYTGLISTLLINFGKSDFIILKEDPGLRISFAKINKPSKILEVKGNNQGEDQYIKAVQRDIANLDEKFLNLNEIENKVTKSVFTNIAKYGMIFAGFALAFTIWFQTKNSSEKDLDRSIKKYQIALETQEETTKLLLQKIRNYEIQLEEKDSILQYRVFNNEKRLQKNDSLVQKKLADNASKLQELTNYINRQFESLNKK